MESDFVASLLGMLSIYVEFSCALFCKLGGQICHVRKVPVFTETQCDQIWWNFAT